MAKSTIIFILSFCFSLAGKICQASDTPKISDSNAEGLQSQCSGVFESKGRILVGPKNEPLTFSHDSELEPYIIAKLIHADKELDASLRLSHLPYKDYREAHKALAFALSASGKSILPLSSLTAESFSEKYLTRSFSDHESVHALDFKPNYLAWMLSTATDLGDLSWGPEVSISFFGLQHKSVGISPKNIDELIKKGKLRKYQKTYTLARANFLNLVSASMIRRGLESEVTLDVGYEIELKVQNPHYSFASLSEEIKGMNKFIRDLGVVGSRPQSHFHLGIPDSVGEKTIVAVSQIVEALIVLDRYVKFKSDTLSPMLYFENSTFFQPALEDITQNFVTDSRRGVVRMRLERFSSPYPSADLEIRQYISLDHVRQLLDTAVRYLQMGVDLEAVVLEDSPFMVDEKFGNVEDSLRLLQKLDFNFQQLIVERHYNDSNPGSATTSKYFQTSQSRYVEILKTSQILDKLRSGSLVREFLNSSR